MKLMINLPFDIGIQLKRRDFDDPPVVKVFLIDRKVKTDSVIKALSVELQRELRFPMLLWIILI